MSNQLPGIPTPPLPPRRRIVVYAIWAWAALILPTIIVGWEVLDGAGGAPKILYAVNVALTFFGSGAGFMAKNNVYPS